MKVTTESIAFVQDAAATINPVTESTPITPVVMLFEVTKAV